MSLEDPVVITCAISGAIANRDQCPAIPYTPEEYARRGAADRRRGRRDDPHPRAPARRDAVVRDRGLPRDHRGDPRAGGRRDHQLLDRRDRRPGREAARLPARAAARRRRAEHGLDELREVLAQPPGVRLQHRLREPVRRDHRAAAGDERARHQARARVLRPRAHRRSLEPLVDMGVLQTPLHVDCVMGVVGGVPPTARNLAAMVDNIQACPAARTTGRVIGISRAAVDAHQRGARARRVDPRRPRGQLLPAGRHDGPLQRRPRRQGARDGRQRRPARPRRSPRRASLLGLPERTAA